MGLEPQPLTLASRVYVFIIESSTGRRSSSPVAQTLFIGTSPQGRDSLTRRLASRLRGRGSSLSLSLWPRACLCALLSRVLDGGARAPSPITLFESASPQGRNSLPRRLASRMPPRSSTPTTHHRALMTYQWLAAELEPGRPHPIPLLESAARSFWLAQ